MSKEQTKVHRAETAKNKLTQPSYEIFNTECKFQQFESQPFTFNEACARGCQTSVKQGYPLKVVSSPLLVCLA